MTDEQPRCLHGNYPPGLPAMKTKIVPEAQRSIDADFWIRGCERMSIKDRFRARFETKLWMHRVGNWR